MNKPLRLLLAAALVLLRFSPTQAQTLGWSQTLDSTLSQVATQGLFDGQVLLADSGHMLFNQAYGDLDGLPITPSTSLPVASLTKAFTASLVLALVAEETLHLEDSLRHFFPELPYSGVTVHHLLSMTSGLPRFFNTATQYSPHDHTITNQAIIGLVAAHPGTADPTGQKFHYNNTNYLLLASIAEKATGHTYPELMEHYVFQPAGLTQTSVALPKTTEAISLDNFYQPYGEGNLRTTVGDLYRFVQALHQGQVLSDSLRDLGWSATPLPHGQTSPFGYAWLIASTDGETRLSLRGDDEGLYAELVYWPTTERLLVYLHVSSGAYAGPVQEMVRAIWEGRPYTVPQARPQITVPPAQLAKYVGQYELPNFGLIHITLENGALYLRPNAIPGKEKLVPASRTTFYFQDQDLAWEFYLDEDGEVLGFGMARQPENMGPKQ